MARRRVFVVTGEYSASPRDLTPARRRRDFFGGPHPELRPEEVCATSSSAIPTAGDDGRTRPEDWEKAFGIREPVALPICWPPRAPGPDHAAHADRPATWRRTLRLDHRHGWSPPCRGSTRTSG